MKRACTRRLSLVLLAAAALPSAALAQANEDPSINVKLGILGELDAVGRSGVFPNGTTAAAMSTTVCNQGDVVPWFAAMNPQHPFIAFLVAREHDGRIEQISDRSWVKHGFFALTSSQCTPCTPPGGASGTFLGIGCSDTYGISNNADNFWLGPPDEIDPWLGTWDPVCSFFDLGTGGLMPPGDCNGLRTFSQTQANNLGPVGNRIHLKDSDLNAGGNFYYQAQYVVATEGDSKRNDNLGTRPFTPVWNGSNWNLNESGTLAAGSVLFRWSGAKVDSNSNGDDDGRAYVAVRTSGPTDGLLHYEIAVHNRDNKRGFRELRIPLCPGARVLNAGFQDIDDDGMNDWSMSIESGGAELVFRDDSTENALRWNSIFNFWFDSDAEAAFAGTSLTQADAGPGADSVGVSIQAPVRLYNVYTGAGCSMDGTPPTLFAAGTPARAALGNATFQLRSGGNVPGQVNALAASNAVGSGAIGLGSCTLWMPGTLDDLYGFASTVVDGSGYATYSLPVPADMALEGLTVNFQALGVNPGGGAVFNVWEFSDGLAVRIGDSIAPCE